MSLMSLISWILIHYKSMGFFLILSSAMRNVQYVAFLCPEQKKAVMGLVLKYCFEVNAFLRVSELISVVICDI